MTTPMPPVPPLDHAAIGNGRVLALVAPTSAIEWLCMPRFDSPSVFARILDSERGGTFRFLEQGAEVEGRMAYVPNTNVVSTVFETDSGAYEVFDFAPRIPEGLSVHVPIEIARIVRPLRGAPSISVDFDPRPDYARAAVDLRQTGDGIEVHNAATPLHLYTNVPVPYVIGKRPFVLASTVWFVLAYGERQRPRTRAEVQHDLDVTIAG